MAAHLNPIAQRFSKASKVYDAHASVQQQVAQVFSAWIADGWHSEANPKALLGVGCGTGVFTRCLQAVFPGTRLMACDWAPEMLEVAKQRSSNIAFFQGDATHFVAPENPDLIASSFCMQWLDDIPAALTHHLRHCKRLAVALPCNGSFEAWNKAHQALGCASGLHPLPNAGELCLTLQTWQEKGLIQQWRCETRQFTQLHADGLAFARSLKAIGAGTPKPGHQPVNLRQLMTLLPKPLNTNYEVLFLELDAPSTAN